MTAQTHQSVAVDVLRDLVRGQREEHVVAAHAEQHLVHAEHAWIGHEVHASALVGLSGERDVQHAQRLLEELSIHLVPVAEGRLWEDKLVVSVQQRGHQHDVGGQMAAEVVL